jgi:hypothetical protein
MLTFLIVLFSTFSMEAADSIGKKNVAKHRETIYGLGFLWFFWVAVFLALSVVFLHADFKFYAASLPTFVPRVLLEFAMVYLGAVSTVKADRSTMGFLRLTTIPLLLVVDLRLGYGITPLQVAGITILFLGMGLLFLRSKRSKKGAGFVLAGSIVAVLTASLYKYDISHFNSVAAEQLIMAVCVMVFFTVLSAVHRTTPPILLVFRKQTGLQSLMAGASLAVESFAIYYVAPSILIALKRGLALVWSIVFGHKWFHEHKFAVKMRAAGVAMVGLVMLVIH